MKKTKKQYAGYFRVSTAGQGQSGAGLAAQKRAVLNFINSGGKLVKCFKEIESGTKDRPELQKAIEYCKQTGAVLVVSKLDRLARSVWLVENIKRTGIEFEIVGFPKNQPVFLQMMAVLGENEARLISERTKAALAEKKAQGVKLGYHRREVRAGLKRYWKSRKQKQKKSGGRKGPKTKKLLKREIADKAVTPHIRHYRKEGDTFKKIAETLNAVGIKGRKGGNWTKQHAWTVARRNGID